MQVKTISNMLFGIAIIFVSGVSAVSTGPSTTDPLLGHLMVVDAAAELVKYSLVKAAGADGRRFPGDCSDPCPEVRKSIATASGVDQLYDTLLDADDDWEADSRVCKYGRCINDNYGIVKGLVASLGNGNVPSKSFASAVNCCTLSKVGLSRPFLRPRVISPRFRITDHCYHCMVGLDFASDPMIISTITVAAEETSPLVGALLQNLLTASAIRELRQSNEELSNKLEVQDAIIAELSSYIEALKDIFPNLAYQYPKLGVGKTNIPSSVRPVVV